MQRARNGLQGKESSFAFFGSRLLDSLPATQERHKRVLQGPNKVGVGPWYSHMGKEKPEELSTFSGLSRGSLSHGVWKDIKLQWLLQHQHRSNTDTPCPSISWSIHWEDRE